MIRNLLILSSLLCSILISQGALTRGPYLQALGHEGVVVRWNTNNPSPGTVRYGTDPANLNLTAVSPSNRQAHEIQISGLIPETVYYYQIEDTGVLAGGGDHYWKTYPVPGTIRPMRIWAIGDPGTATQNQLNVRDAYIAYNNNTGERVIPSRGHTDTMLMLGDIAYNDGTEAQFQNAVFDAYPSLLRNTGVYVTRGNHERNVSVYYNNLTMPTAGENGGLPSGTEAYYSFDRGHVHFVCLDSYGTDRSASSPMWTWLENDLATTTAEFVIAFFHHPPYTKGSHDSDRERDLIDMRTRALPIFDQYGVDLCLTGHSHSYERSYQIAGHYGTSPSFDPISMMVNAGNGNVFTDGAYQNGNGDTGTVYIVAGSSGKVSSSIPSPANWHSVMHEMLRELGSVVIDVDGGRMDVGFLDDAGNLKDTFTILHPEIDYPLIVDAAPQPAYITADLNANLLATGAFTTVEVFWATNDLGTDPAAWGSNTVNLGIQPEGLVTYTLTGLTEETVYTYRVRASNADGESWTEAQSFRTTTRSPSIVSVIGGIITNEVEIIPENAVWSYYDQGSEPNGQWKRSNYNDNGWSSGPGDFGYGDGDEGTTVGFGPNPGSRYVTSYYRHNFSIANPAELSGAEIELVRDDGIAVYFNETEIHRSNLPTGSLSYNNLANATAAGDGKPALRFPLTEPLLANNVFAAELHQRSVVDSDASFSLRLFTQQREGDHGATNLTYQSASVGFELVNEGQGPANITLFYGLNDPGASNVGWANSIDLGQHPQGAVEFTTINFLQDETTYFYRYRVVNAFGEAYTLKGEFTTRSKVPEIENSSVAGIQNTQEILIGGGSVWNYLDNGSNQGTAWRANGFNDAAWASGPGELGYGDGGEATVVSFGGNANNKHITTYFRQSFSLPATPALYDNLAVQLIRDDGAMVYLNGVEVVRSNMPAGNIGSVTVAAGTAEGNTVENYSITNQLVPGKNVVAVSIHQRSPTSSDISFNMSLTADRANSQDAYNITINSADVRGELLNEGQGPTTVIVYYGRADGGSNPATWESSLNLGPQTEGLIDASLTNLALESDYYFRFYAQNSAGSDWAGETGEFRVLDAFPAISQSTTPNSTSYTSATVVGTLIDDAAFPTTVRVYYGTTDGGTNPAAWQNVQSLGVRPEGGLAQSLSGLTHNTTYYFRYQAENQNGAEWSQAVGTFTTQDGTPEIVNNPATQIDFDSAQVNGRLITDGSAANTVKVYLGTADGGTNPGNWPIVIDLGSRFAGTLSSPWNNLSNSTTYYYRFFTENIYSSDWSPSAQTFTTTSGAPVISNAGSPVSGLAADRATLNGNLSFEGLAPTTVSLLWGTSDGGATVASWQNNTSLGAQGQGALSQLLTGLSPSTTYYFRYVASNAGGTSIAPATATFTTPSGMPDISVALPQVGAIGNEETIAMPKLCVWRYFDNGSNLGTAWRQSAYDASAWPMGWARLGYGIGDEATTLGYGPNPGNKFITTYFRSSFYVDDPANYDLGEVRLFAGDGAQVYVNGLNVGGVNLPANPTHTTRALIERPATQHDISMGTGILQAGVNTIAAEVHQASGGGVDISFDLELALIKSVQNYTFPGIGSTSYSGASVRYALLDDGGSPVQVTLYYGSSDAGATTVGWDGSINLGAKTIGNHATNVGGLQPGTRTYYRIRALNSSNQDDWSEGPAFFDTLSASADLDADGMPDFWEIQNFGNTAATAIADADADGANNLAEYLAGTNPNSASSTLNLLCVHDASDDATITFASRMGQPYLLEFCPDLTNGTWEPKDLLFGTGSDLNHMPSGQGINGFYRLNLPVK